MRRWRRGDPALMHHVSTELALAESEHLVRERLVATGQMPPGAWRDLHPHEIAAGTRFAEIDSEAAAAASLLARTWAGLRTQALDTLAAYLWSNSKGDRLARLLLVLSALADPADPARLPLTAEVAAAAAQMTQVLEDLRGTAAAQLLDEARRQGVPEWRLGAPAGAGSELLGALGQALATHAVQHAVEGALAAARAAVVGPGAPTRQQVLAEAAAQSTKAGDDQARQAANRASGLGRGEAAEAGPRPQRIYSSEIMDRSTCRPCAEVDGREYPSEAAALGDYPAAGAYRGCEGGSRCRGTLVYVWGESPATM